MRISPKKVRYVTSLKKSVARQGGGSGRGERTRDEIDVEYEHGLFLPHLLRAQVDHVDAVLHRDAPDGRHEDHVLSRQPSLASTKRTNLGGKHDHDGGALREDGLDGEDEEHDVCDPEQRQ